jgi:hypothetical protein
MTNRDLTVESLPADMRPADMRPADRRPVPLLPFAAQLNLGVLCLIGAGLLISRWLPPGPFTHGTNIAQQLIAFDGQGYRDIAVHGYTWKPGIGGTFGHGETMALFPAWPVIESLLGRLTGSLSPWVIIAAGLFFGLWSNVVFGRLARRLLPAAAAKWATLCFAIWPASCFLVMGYPVRLINLCAASSLWHYVEGRRLRAVLWCGLGTAAAPAGVFIAIALCADLGITAFVRSETIRGWVRLAGLGILSVWGLIGFMVYQQFRFQDPLAFVAAQGGFSETPPPLIHIFRVCDVLWYLFPLQYSRDTFVGLFFHHAGTAAQSGERLGIAWQLDQDVFAVALAILLLVRAARRFPDLLLPLSGWVILAGYLWFVVPGSFDLLCGVRLLYPALAIFLVLGQAAAENAFVRYATLIWLALSSVAAAALVGGGYGMI